MSTLQVANLHLESTGNNRIQNINSTSFAIVAGGATVITANSTAAAIVGGIIANGSVGTAGQTLLSGGSGANAYWGTAGGNYAMQVFTDTTPGGVTWTKPDGLKAVKVTVVGGGGGLLASPTSNAGGAGGGGAAIEYIPAPSIPGPVTVTVGTAGGTTAPTLSGGTSSFGAFCSATGGAGSAGSTSGNAPVSTNGGAGGAGSGGTVNFTGQSGGNSRGDNISVPTTPGTPLVFKGSFAGAGGGSIFGGGGQAGSAFDSLNGPSAGAIAIGASSGYTYGGGASGKVNSSSTGVVGFQGVVIVEEFY